MLLLLTVTKAKLVAQFLRARAWWRLDSAGPSALTVARSVVSLLDAVVYLQDVPDDDPHIVVLETAGCFRGGAFDPGPEGAAIIRDWQLADEASAGAADLLAELAWAAHRTRPGAAYAVLAESAAPVSVPRQARTPARTQAQTRPTLIPWRLWSH